MWWLARAQFFCQNYALKNSNGDHFGKESLEKYNLKLTIKNKKWITIYQSQIKQYFRKEKILDKK